MMARTLKALKEDLKTWNEHVVGNVGGQKHTLFAELRGSECGGG